MKKVLVFTHPHYEPEVYDVSTKEQLDKTYLLLFDNIFGLYTPKENEVGLYTLAKGNDIIGRNPQAAYEFLRVHGCCGIIYTVQEPLAKALPELCKGYTGFGRLDG